MTRRALAAILLALLVAGAVPAGAATPVDGAYEDKLSASAESIDGFLGYDTPEYVLTYGAGDHPGWYVSYDNDTFASLEEWVDASDDRAFVAHDNASDRSLVSAPAVDVLGGLAMVESDVGPITFSRPTWVSNPLVERSYVTHLDVNVEMALAEPVELENASEAYTRPVPNAAVRGAWETDGIAFDRDVESTTIEEVKDAVGVDDVSENGTGVTVAVIDTGVNTNNGVVFGNGTDNSTIRIDAAKNFITNESAEINDTSKEYDFSNVSDGNGHGTWVASAIAANTTNASYDGVAPGANLLIGKALNDDGSGSTQDIVEAIEWAEDNDADIVSLSLGSPVYSPTLAAEIQEALDGSVSMVVVAVGNSRMNPATRYISSPADTDHAGVIGVAAATTNSSENASVAYFSEVGPDSGREDLSRGVTLGEGPDVAAPGMEVTAATLNTGGTRYNETLSGTSMATPIVAGVLALNYEAHSGDLNDSNATREWLLDSASPIDGAGTTEVGAGMVNASALLDQGNASESQSAARSDAATGRDVANEAFSGSRVARWLADATGGLFGAF